MQAAISSLLLKSRPLEDVLRLAHEVGVSWVEVWSEHLWRDDDGKLLERIRRSGLDISVHGPTGDINITSSNPGIRNESLRQVLRGVEEAAKMGARVVTVHPGFLTGRQDTADSIWDLQIEAFTRITKRAKDLGILIAMETMEKKSKEVVIRPDLANQIVDAVNFENFGITFDISHAHTVMDVVTFIHGLRKINHIHISDTKDGKVHVQMGEGEIDFPSVLRALKQRYDGALVIEGWNPIDEMGMLEKSAKFLESRLQSV